MFNTSVLLFLELSETFSNFTVFKFGIFCFSRPQIKSRRAREMRLLNSVSTYNELELGDVLFNVIFSSYPNSA